MTATTLHGAKDDISIAFGENCEIGSRSQFMRSAQWLGNNDLALY
jgi:hypothetical protein